MPTEADLLRDIRAFPGDNAPRLVYADWLSEKGDPRGELVALQCQKASLAINDDLRPKLEQREHALLQAHQGQWLKNLPEGPVPYAFDRGFLAHPLALPQESRLERRHLLRLSPTLYEVVRVVGDGRTQVLEAMICGPDGPEGRVALRRFRTYSADPDLLDHTRRTLKRELEVTRMVRHPGVVEVHGLAYLDGEVVLAMEWLDGLTLRSLAQRYGERRLPPAFAAAVGLSLSQALSVVHGFSGRDGKPLLHRAIRPDHVMVTREGQVKLIDFSEADPPQAHGHVEEQIVPDPNAHDLAHLSYEQARGDTLDGRSDLFSLGAMMYQLCSRERMIRGESQVQIMAALMAEPIPPLSKVAPMVPASLVRVIDRAVLRDRNKRFRAAEMAARLERVMQDEKWPSPMQIVSKVVGRVL